MRPKRKVLDIIYGYAIIYLQKYINVVVQVYHYACVTIILSSTCATIRGGKYNGKISNESQEQV